MTSIIIDSLNHTHYDQFNELYRASFPPFEQRTERQQQAAFDSSNYSLKAYLEDGCFVGFIASWEFETYLYIEHFAVSEALRHQGFGGDLIRDFLAQTSKLTLLEIDPITDSASEARLRFYTKYGFIANHYAHFHPPYQSGREAHRLIVLSSRQEINENQYRRFSSDLTQIVMA